MIKELPPIEARSAAHVDGVPVVPASEKKYSYYWLARAKKSQPWSAVAVCFVAGDACYRNAELHFAKHGLAEVDYSLGKLVDGPTWHRFQVTQHLKAVGIKRSR